MKLSKTEAIDKLEKSIQRIDVLKQSEGFTPDFEKWRRDTEIAIENIFSAQSRNIKDFTSISYSLMIATNNTPESAWTNAYRGGLEHAKAILNSMVDEIKDYWPSEVTLAGDVAPASSGKANTSGIGTDIFIIHGHNGELKETVARFIERLGLKAVILHEQPNQGRTIIEKLEHNSDFTSFAIALFTSDDVGAAKSNPQDLKPRARQNVVLEFGYFMGKLGRARGCAIVQEGIELPSDNAGIAYIPYDANGAWRMELSRELKAAGFAVDMNLVY